jgi:hypothetical protein
VRNRPRPPLDRAILADKALRALAVALAPYLREIAAAESQARDLLGVAKLPIPKRAAYAACRRGEIQDAAKVARKWVASRGAVEEWFSGHVPSPKPAKVDEPDEFEELRRSLAKHAKQRQIRQDKR